MFRSVRRRHSRYGKPPAGSRRNYRSLAQLLDSQPKGLTRFPDHRLLWDHFLSSDKLQKLRISPRCYRLLNEAKVPPENLKNFYDTYRLPEDPFFAWFLKVKTEWFAERERWQEERRQAILSTMNRLPEHRRKALRILAEYEKRANRFGDFPLWENRLYPRTKKRAGEFLRFGEAEWHDLWRNHLIQLSWKYRSIPPLEDEAGNPTYTARLLATLVLRCSRVDRKEIGDNFRKLSKEFHPDRGGDAEHFHRIKAARDLLLSRE